MRLDWVCAALNQESKFVRVVCVSGLQEHIRGIVKTVCAKTVFEAVNGLQIIIRLTFHFLTGNR